MSAQQCNMSLQHLHVSNTLIGKFFILVCIYGVKTCILHPKIIVMMLPWSLL